MDDDASYTELTVSYVEGEQKTKQNGNGAQKWKKEFIHFQIYKK